MIPILSILSMFTLLVICSFVFFLAKRTNLPYTVMLVLVGLLIVPISQIPFLNPIFGFLTEFHLTPELLFYIFLPTLIFESGFNMNIRQIINNTWSITILSVFGLLISALIISVLLYFLLPLLGLQIPFILLLLFASIISATDPVAVLALFKEYKAPKRLTLIFEGESLFNDGTAVAMFLVVLAIAQKGFKGFETVLGGIEMFLMMIFIGIFFGMFMALAFSFFLKYTKENEFVSITLLIVSAHIVFILSELINQNGILGLPVHISPIIATTFAAIFLGNYARHILSPKSDEYIEKSISHLAFIINSLVFILVGILFATTKIEFSNLFIPVGVTILVVALARAVSVYASIYPINKFKMEENIPLSWQHLLSWGSLRGALAIIIVLLIPDDFTVNGWAYSFSPKEFLIALTTGCILATLFIKATTIKKIMNWLQVYDNNVFTEITQINFAFFTLQNKLQKITNYSERQFLYFTNQNLRDHELKVVNKNLEDIRTKRQTLLEKFGENVFVHELHLRAISIEEKYLKELYINNEIVEKVYRRLKNKLNIQKEKIEQQEIENFDSSIFTDRKDIFDRFINLLLAPFDKKRTELSDEEKLEYYRAQTIISRKVVKNLNEINSLFPEPIYPDTIFQKVITMYDNYRQNSNVKFLKILSQLENSNPVKASMQTTKLNKSTLDLATHKSVFFLNQKGVINESEAEEILNA